MPGASRQSPLHLHLPQAVLPWLAAERRGERVVRGWGVPGHGAVMGPGLLGEPAEAQGLTGGAAGW